jgi:hypothetical protein
MNVDLRRTLAPELAAAAVAVFIPWRGGADQSDRRWDGTRADGVWGSAAPAISFLAYCLAAPGSHGVIVAGRGGDVSVVLSLIACFR